LQTEHGHFWLALNELGRMGLRRYNNAYKGDIYS
jgi:hypothetical protein